MRERTIGGRFRECQQHRARSRFGWGLGKGGAVQAAELDAATRSNNRDFSRSFLRLFERQCVFRQRRPRDRERHRTGSSVRPNGLSSPLKPPHRPTLRMNASQKQLSRSVQEHGAMMARELLPWEHRPMTKKITLEQTWHQLSKAAKKEAEKLPHGKEREALLRKARQLETASQIDQWISSPALQPPT